MFVYKNVIFGSPNFEVSSFSAKVKS